MMIPAPVPCRSLSSDFVPRSGFHSSDSLSSAQYDMLDLTKLGYYLYVSEKYMIGFLGICFWDLLALLPSEYRLIWNDRRTTSIKIAYIVNRYGMVANVIAVLSLVFSAVSPTMCKRVSWLLSLGVTAGTAVCDVIVGIRVFAVYEFKKWVLSLLGIIYVIEIGCMLFTVTRLIPLNFGQALGDYLNYHGCTPINPPTSHAQLYALLYWTPSLLFNLVALGLLIGRQVYISRRTDSNNLLQRLIRDGALYFTVIVAVDVTSLYFSAQNNQGLSNINVYTSSVLKSLICTRLVLGLRERAHRSSGVQNKLKLEPTKLAPWVPPHLLPRRPTTSLARTETRVV